MKTMLQIIQAAAGELGIPRPTLVTGSTTTDTIQLLALLNGLGGDLQQGFIWQDLSTEYAFTTEYLSATGTTVSGSAVVTGLSSTTGVDSTYMVVGTGINTDTYVLTNDSATQVTLNQPATASGTVTLTFCKTKYPFPADFDRSLDKTQWDKTQHWQMLGPKTAQQWAWLKSGYISTGPRLSFRVLGGTFQIWPAITNAERIGFEYISAYWARTAAGVAKAEFTLDDDVCMFPDRLMITGLKMRYQEAKGLGDDFSAKFEQLLAIAQGADAGSDTLNLGGGRAVDQLIDWRNIPDSGYGE